MTSTDSRMWIWKLLSTRNGFFKLLVLVATGLASVVSFYATAQGLTRYFDFWVATGLALAVQLGLFGLAWLVGLERSSGRALLAIVYVGVMCFSVTFSYVFFQSALGRQVKPALQARMLTDELEKNVRVEIERAGTALAGASEAKLRLESWLQLEERVGFATQTCANEPVAYLNEVCRRLQERVTAWQRSTGQPYRQGPGQSLIYGALKQELEVVSANAAELSDYRQRLQSRPFGVAKPPSDRIASYNGLLSGAPAALLARYSGPSTQGSQQVLLSPNADVSGEQEAPLGALMDLVRLRGKAQYDELDLVSIGAVLLAVFIDLFVFAVAFGAGHFGFASAAPMLPIRRPLRPEWDDDIISVVGGWIREATLRPRHTATEQIEFIRGVLGTVQSRGGEIDELTTGDPSQARFGDSLVRSRVATLAGHSEAAGVAGVSTYRLKAWVPAALLRFMELTAARSDARPETA